MDPSRIQEQDTAAMMSVVEPSTPEQFEQYYDLRWRILRAPWRQPRGSEKDELENDSIHLMVSDNDNRVIGVGRLHLNSPKQAQIRFMAVETDYQREGIGSKLLLALEESRLVPRRSSSRRVPISPAFTSVLVIKPSPRVIPCLAASITTR